MSIWIYVIAGLVVLGYLSHRRVNKVMGIPILKVRIGTPNGDYYKVKFEKFHPDTGEIEYVRIVLNFVAKMLFIIQTKHVNVGIALLKFLKDVVGTNKTPEKIDALLPIYAEGGEPSGKIVEGILHYKDNLTRNITTKLPGCWYEYQLAHSAFALIKVAVENLGEHNRMLLKKSLSYMVDLYWKGEDTKDLNNMVNLPNEAFASATFDTFLTTLPGKIKELPLRR